MGPYDQVIHENESEGFHLDLLVVPPTEEDDFYQIVTMGAGAYRMNVPETLKDDELEYAEYIMYLPKDWPVDKLDDDCAWPYYVLRSAARLPMRQNSWLGYGHTILEHSDGSQFAEGAGFNSTLLINTFSLKGETLKLRLSSGKLINFYLLVPLYPDELKFKKKFGAYNLLNYLEDTPDFPIVNTARESVLDTIAETVLQ